MISKYQIILILINQRNRCRNLNFILISKAVAATGSSKATSLQVVVPLNN